MARKRNKPITTPKQNKQNQKFKRHRRSQEQKPARRTSTSLPPLKPTSTTPKTPQLSPSQQDLYTHQQEQQSAPIQQQEPRYRSEVVSRWAAEMEAKGKAELVDKALQHYNTTQELETAIQNGTISQLETDTPIIDGTTGEVYKRIPENINIDRNFYTDVIITSWFAQLDHFSGGEAHDFLKNWANDMIHENGRDNFAEMIQQGTADGNFLTWEVVYRMGEAERYIAAMLDYLPDQGELYKDDIKDKFDFYRRMSEAFERDEDWENPE